MASEGPKGRLVLLGFVARIAVRRLTHPGRAGYKPRINGKTLGSYTMPLICQLSLLGACQDSLGKQSLARGVNTIILQTILASTTDFVLVMAVGWGLVWEPPEGLSLDVAILRLHSCPGMVVFCSKPSFNAFLPGLSV